GADIPRRGNPQWCAEASLWFRTLRAGSRVGSGFGTLLCDPMVKRAFRITLMPCWSFARLRHLVDSKSGDVVTVLKSVAQRGRNSADRFDGLHGPIKVDCGEATNVRCLTARPPPRKNPRGLSRAVCGFRAPPQSRDVINGENLNLWLCPPRPCFPSPSLAE